jgi:hypothetical protein
MRVLVLLVIRYSEKLRSFAYGVRRCLTGPPILSIAAHKSGGRKSSLS